MNDLILFNGTALTMDNADTEVPHAVIEVRGGRILSITSDPKYRPPASISSIDANGGWILPGFINAHTHVGMTLLRGVADDLPLRPWLEDQIFPREKKFGGPDFVRMGTQLAAAELIRNGITTINDMYYFEDTVASTLHEVGMRGVLGQAVIEIGGVEELDQILERLEDFVEGVKAYPTIFLPI